MWGFWVMPMQMIMTSVSTVRMTMFFCVLLSTHLLHEVRLEVSNRSGLKRTCSPYVVMTCFPSPKCTGGIWIVQSFLFASTHSNSFPFLTWKIFVIFQVVVVGRFHSLTPSLPVGHLEIRGELSYEEARNTRRKIWINSEYGRLMWTLPELHYTPKRYHLR